MTFPSKNIAKKDHLIKSQKGGLAGKGKVKLSKNKNCTTECPVFRKCHYVTLSEEKFKGKCALVHEEGLDRGKQLFEFMNSGRETMMTIIYNELLKLWSSAETFKDKLALIDRVIKIIQLRIPDIEEDNLPTPLDIWNYMEEHLSELEEKAIEEAKEQLQQEAKAMKKR